MRSGRRRRVRSSPVFGSSSNYPALRSSPESEDPDGDSAAPKLVRHSWNRRSAARAPRGRGREPHASVGRTLRRRPHDRTRTLRTPHAKYAAGWMPP
jgi:hypothetical protein